MTIKVQNMDYSQNTRRKTIFCFFLCTTKSANSSGEISFHSIVGSMLCSNDTSQSPCTYLLSASGRVAQCLVCDAELKLIRRRAICKSKLSQCLPQFNLHCCNRVHAEFINDIRCFEIIFFCSFSSLFIPINRDE